MNLILNEHRSPASLIHLLSGPSVDIRNGERMPHAIRRNILQLGSHDGEKRSEEDSSIFADQNEIADVANGRLRRSRLRANRHIGGIITDIRH